MRGFPKYINNRNDLDNCAAEYPQETIAFLRDILDFKDVWISTGLLADGDIGLADETHKVVESKNMDDVVTQRYQYEFMEDLTQNGPICRFGFADGEQMHVYMKSIHEAA